MFVISSKTFFPDWAIGLLMAIAIVVLFIGVLGGRGAMIAWEKLSYGNYNYWLIVLTIIVGILMLLELASGVWLVVEFGVISNTSLNEKSDGLTASFENSIKSQMTKESDAWWDWQKQFECCGYDNNTIPAALATGKFCTTSNETSAVACKEKLWADVGEKSLPISIFMILFMLIQLIVFISALCLACIIKPQEPIYRNG